MVIEGMGKAGPMKSTMTLATIVVIALAGKAAAHEFWIDPAAFEIAVDAPLVADLRVGTGFEGVAMSHIPRRFDRFDIVQGASITEVAARVGDIPALNMGGFGDGLAVIVHQTAMQRLTWAEWERFAGFLAHKDLGDAAALQAARGLDRTDVREGYVRFAKSLVGIGGGSGRDRRVGLRTEIVALANPYTDDLARGLPVRVWLDDTPRADVQVELFERAPDGGVAVTLHRTDAEGIAVLPVQRSHAYMVDAVALEPVEPRAAQDPEWITLWANSTFAVPD